MLHRRVQRKDSLEKAAMAAAEDSPHAFRTPLNNEPMPQQAAIIPISEKKPESVYDLTRRLKQVLENRFPDVWVEGEVSNYKPAPSGHVYFNLKDNQAMISCVLWASDAARLKIPIKSGDSVEIHGRVSVFESRGNYQLNVQSIRPAGIGRLYLAFQELKEKLQSEGLFDSERKRTIPSLPKVIGVITSPTGAAIRDILTVLERRAPHLSVVIYPSRVQGAEAASEIAYAINRMNQLANVEVLIVGRGGGSIEDLWPFNEEIVARAIANSAIPVISAVGHEVDFTIADFVADLRAPTPSAAAEIISRNSVEMLRELQHCSSRLMGAMNRRIQQFRDVRFMRQRLENALIPRVELYRSHIRAFESSHALQRPLHRINELRQRLDDHTERTSKAILRRQQERSSRYQRLCAQLSALNPTSILQRGYSITFDSATGTILRDEADALAGQALQIVLHKGKIEAVVGNASPRSMTKTRKKKDTMAVLDWFGRAPLSCNEDSSGES